MFGDMMMDGGSTTPAIGTWDAAKAGSGIVLSGGDLTVSRSAGSAWATVLSQTGNSTGKKQFEITGSRATNDYIIFGVGTSAISLTNFVGSSSTGWGWLSDRAAGPLFYNNNSGASYGAVANAATAGVVVDFTAGTLTFYLDGASQGTAATGLSGTLYAAASIYTNGYSLTINLGATAFAYPISGATAWG